MKKMAKPERHPWAYGPQWNYYPPHVLNLPKIPFPNGPQGRPDTNENYLAVKCPEPRRPYQVPYPPFGPYSHQEHHSIHGPFIQPNTIYPPKPYVHRPIPYDNYNNSFKISENTQSYPTCSKNYSVTKDQSSCYQNSWNNTSQCQKKQPELDVRRFLATWQEKDDDLDGPTENEEHRVCQGYDSIPLDCTKRNNADKPLKRNYENFASGQSSNTAGCVVQPYYIKENHHSAPLHRGVISSGEMNNNIPYRNNLNYGLMNPEGCHNKNYYHSSEFWKPSDKMLSSEHHAVTYPSQLNHCDINVNPLRNNISYRRPKDNLIDTSERSHYNLSSLETEDLFCDINSRNDSQPKQPVVHPFYNDLHHKSFGCDEQAYYGSGNSAYSENLVYSDLHPIKDNFEPFPQNIKCKDSYKVAMEPKPSIHKVQPHPQFDPNLHKMNNPSNGSIMYEGAFNILPNLNESNIPLTNAIQYNNSIPLQTDDSSSKPPGLPQPLMPVKDASLITKCIQGSNKIKPFHFNEEISSDDIDISIASSGDLVVDEEHSAIGPISVINFSRAKKEKIDVSPTKVEHISQEPEQPDGFTVPIFTRDPEKSLETGNSNLNESTAVEAVLTVANNIIQENLKNNLQPTLIPPENCLETSDKPLKPDAVDLTILKPAHEKEENLVIEKQTSDLLDISNTYFGDCVLEKNNDTEVASNGTEESTFSSQNVLTNDETSDLKTDTVISKDEFLISSSPKYNLVSPIPKTPDNNTQDSNDSFVTNDNLLLLARCSQEYGGPIANDNPQVSLPEIDCHQEPTESEDSRACSQLIASQLDEHSSFCSVKYDSEIPFGPEEDLVKCSKNSVDFVAEDIQEELINPEVLAGLAVKSDDDSHRCSQENGCQFVKAVEDSQLNNNIKLDDDPENQSKPVRDSVIKCSLRWDKIFNVISDEDITQPDVSLDLGPAKVELRMPPENCSSGQWKVVEADSKVPTSSIVQVKRLILKRKSQSEERIPKMVIKKTENQEYRSYLKKEANETVLNCGKFKIFYDISSKSKSQNDQISDL